MGRTAPRPCTPYNRFALAGFADDAGEILARAHEVRARMRWARRLLPLPVGALAAALVAEDLAGGVLGRVSVGVLAALVAWALVYVVAAWRAWGGAAVWDPTVPEAWHAALSLKTGALVYLHP